MLIAEKYEVPDECPSDCKFIEDGMSYQGSICTRCPIFVCKSSDKYGPMVTTEDYRPDWARQWHLFFNGEIERPVLYLEMRVEDLNQE